MKFQNKNIGLGLYLVFSMALSLSITLDSYSQTGTEVTKAQTDTSVAIVLVGDGEGVVTKIAAAVAVKSDGVFLVPYHVVKDAKEVQVRLKNGEIFDHVSLLAADERRDVAAIKIQTNDVYPPPIASLDDIKTDSPIQIFTHRIGKTWSVSEGKIIGVKLADELPNAGQGFRVIQFDGSIGKGTDGGVVFDFQGKLIGIITSEFSSDAKSSFAVPVSNVRSLSESGKLSSYATGHRLKLPLSEAAFNAAKNPSDPVNLLMTSKTVYVETNTTFFKEQHLINELNKRKEIKDWGWVLLTGSWDARNKADLIIELDHQILTFNFTFTLRHRKSSVLITAGKVIIADGATGSPKMVDRIIKNVSEILNPKQAKGK